MRVLYDFGILAQAFDRPAARTGILRVVEKVAHALAARSDCTVGFTAGESLGGVVDYLRDHPDLPAAVPHSAAAIAASRWCDPLRRFVWDSAANRSLVFRGLRWGARRVTEGLEASFTHLSPAKLRGFDIFHAPCSPFPRHIQADTRLRKLVTIYDLIPLRAPEFFGPEVLRVARRRLTECRRDDTWVLAISQATKDDLCDYSGIAPGRVFVTPLAAGAHFYPERDPAVIAAARQRYGIPDGPYLLSVCTLEPRKNLHSVIAAFASLVEAEKIADLRLVLVGNVGWSYERIFAESARYPELRERIVFPGFVPDDDLRAIYSGALAFLYLSVYEGFGLPPLEAMQCGVPTITSNVSSLPEVVGDAAIQVPPHDLPAISAAMLRLYRDPVARAHFVAAGLARARQHSWERCADATVAAYRAILQS